MKRRLTALLIIIVTLTMMIDGTVFAATSGTCGNVSWTLTGSTLKITGTGAMADYANPNSYPWYSNRESISSVVISSGVTHIGDYAFYDYDYLTSITFANTLSSIGEYAFSKCDNLSSISLTGNNLVLETGAFDDCLILSSVTVGSGVQEIGQYCFRNCYNISTLSLGSSLKTIGEQAFYKCGTIATLTIPNSVTTLSTMAFSNCTGLTKVTMGTGLKEIGSGAFSGCTKLTDVTIGSNVETINSAAFQSCGALKTITIPNKVSSIGANAFARCSSLSTVYLGNSVGSGSLGSNCFYKITATVYYPKSWGSAPSNNYGGTKITWKENPNSSSTIALSITSQPQSKTIDEGNNASFSVTASGTGLTYQWQESKDNGSTWSNATYTGATTSTMTVNGTLARNGYRYRCSIKDSSANTVVSNVVILTVNAVITINNHPSNQTVNEGNTVYFSVNATGTSLNYKWMVDKNNNGSWVDITSATSNTLTLSNVTTSMNGYAYRCMIYNSGKVVYSNSAYLYVNSTACTTHTWNSGVVTTPATCTKEGLKTFTCTKCSATKTETIAKAAHTEVANTNIAATCETAGRTGGTHCSVCNATIKSATVVPATGHSWDAGVVTTEPTINSTGVRTFTCTNPNCGKTKTETIPKLDPTALHRGDVNLDGYIDASDLTVLARHVAKIEDITNTYAKANADVDGKNGIDAADLTALARHVAKIESID